MKVAIVVVALVLLSVFGWILWSAGAFGVEQAKRQPWPAGLESADALMRRYPPTKTNAAARRLVALAARVGVDFNRRSRTKVTKQAAVNAWLMAQATATTDRLTAPPQEVSAWMAGNATGLAALREHLVSGDPIQWDFSGGADSTAAFPNLLAHLQLSRQLVASGLLRELRGEAGAWDDLHAAWELSAILQRRPELICRLVALGIARQVNTAARMLSQPAPAWFAEVTATDFVKTFMESMQFETVDAGKRVAAQRGFRGWLGRLQYPSYVTFQRAILSDVSATTACGADVNAIYQRRAEELPSWNRAPVSVPSIASVWVRAWRYRIEREATANALRVHAGLPVGRASACSDVSWTTAPASDGVLLQYNGPALADRGADMPRQLLLHAGK
jgi:hypothetical protein